MQASHCLLSYFPVKNSILYTMPGVQTTNQSAGLATFLELRLIARIVPQFRTRVVPIDPSPGVDPYGERAVVAITIRLLLITPKPTHRSMPSAP